MDDRPDSVGVASHAADCHRNLFRFLEDLGEGVRGDDVLRDVASLRVRLVAEGD